MYPKLLVNLNHIRYNARFLLDKAQKLGVNITAVTKVTHSHPEIVKVLFEEGFRNFGDSRITNLKKIKSLSLPVSTTLLRLPQLSEVKEVVKYADVSLNSELSTLKALNAAAQKQKKVHKVILMVEAGDLREGIMPEEVVPTVREVLNLKNLLLLGLGVNLACYGGVIPRPENLKLLLELKNEIEGKFSIPLPVLSGGNSASLPLLFTGELPAGINQLRVGEALLLGTNPLTGKPFSELKADNFILQGEIIELKVKPSKPWGPQGRDAFGNYPSFPDRGIRKRAIVALGKQEIYPEHLFPKLPGAFILGSSSDHLILDVEDSPLLKIGDILDFSLDYGGVLASFSNIKEIKIIK